MRVCTCSQTFNQPFTHTCPTPVGVRKEWWCEPDVTNLDRGVPTSAFDPSLRDRLRIPDPSSLPYMLREGGRYRASGECLSRYGARGKPCGWKCMWDGGGVGTAVVSITSRCVEGSAGTLSLSFGSGPFNVSSCGANCFYATTLVAHNRSHRCV